MIVTFGGPLTEQGPVPLQPPPLQPAKTEPGAAVAANVTGVPLVTVTEHVVPQSSPGGVIVTVPEPLPDVTTASVNI